MPSLWPVRGGDVRESHGTDSPGVIIAAREGSLIRASAEGTVAKVGFDEVLGNVVVVDHGNGVSSMYGYAATVLVKPGRYVNKGQAIGLCGRSSVAGQGALYFAVLEDGEHRDPLTYRLWL